MTELNELYQELILDHGQNPRNFGKLDNANHFANGNNPLCGDKLKLYLLVEDNIIKDAMFDGSGCAISIASASMMTDMIKNKTIDEAEKIFKNFHLLVTSDDDVDIDNESLEKINALAGVKDYPMRVKCATLAWHTMDAAFKNSVKEISTEK